MEIRNSVQMNNTTSFGMAFRKPSADKMQNFVEYVGKGVSGKKPKELWKFYNSSKLVIDMLILSMWVMVVFASSQHHKKLSQWAVKCCYLQN